MRARALARIRAPLLRSLQAGLSGGVQREPGRSQVFVIDFQFFSRSAINSARRRSSCPSRMLMSSGSARQSRPAVAKTYGRRTVPPMGAGRAPVPRPPRSGHFACRRSRGTRDRRPARCALGNLQANGLCLGVTREESRAVRHPRSVEALSRVTHRLKRRDEVHVGDIPRKAACRRTAELRPRSPTVSGPARTSVRAAGCRSGREQEGERQRLRPRWTRSCLCVFGGR